MNPPLAARLAGAPVGPNAPSVRVVGSSTPRSADGPDQATAILAAAHLLLPNLEHGQRLNAGVLRAAMTQGAGVIRDAAGLGHALRRIATIETEGMAHPRIANMTAAATLICAAALMRRESRGAHCRSDHPDTLPEARRSRLTLAEAMTLRASLATEPEPT